MSGLILLILVLALPAGAQYFEWSRAAESDLDGILWMAQDAATLEAALVSDISEVRAAAAMAIGDLEDFEVLRVSEVDVYAFARLTPWEGPRLLHSADGGASWTQLWTRSGYGDDGEHNRIHAVEADATSDSLWVATSFGVFLVDPLSGGDREMELPPLTDNVVGLARDPTDPTVLWVTTKDLSVFYTGTVSGDGLFRRRATADGAIWEDASLGMHTVPSALGVHPERPEMLYGRTGALVQAVSIPERITPESVGWQHVVSAPESLPRPRPQAGRDALRVHLSYPRDLVVSTSIDFLSKGLDGYPLAVGPRAYAQTHFEHGGLRSINLRGSRDGGVSWTLHGGGYGYFRSRPLGGELLLWDNREGVALYGGGLPQIGTSSTRTFTYHPLDEGTVYVLQRGRGHVFRSSDLRSWEELSAGLDPMWQPRDVVVDSLSRIYLVGDDTVLMRQGVERPFRLNSVTAPDTVRRGQGAFRVAARAARAGMGVGMPKVVALFDGQEHDMTPGNDGVYSVNLPRSVNPGFYSVTVMARPEDMPDARVSQAHEVMLAPATPVALFTEGTQAGWSLQDSTLAADTMASAPLTTRRSLALQGTIVFERTGEKVHPFGYRLRFYVGALDSSLGGLRVNDQDLEALQAEISPVRRSPGWFGVSLPAERLYEQPQRGLDAAGTFFAPALIGDIRLSTVGSITLNDLQLVPVGLRDDPITAVTDMVASTPRTFHLEPNVPNPFNASTTIRFALPTDTRAVLQVFNLAGQLVRNADLGMLPEGKHQVVWDGRDDAGRELATGVYLYRLDGAAPVARRMLLLR